MSTSRTLAILISATCALGCGPEPTARRHADAGAPPPVVTPFDGEEVVGKIRMVQRAADVALGGHRIDVHPGDWLLESEKTVAVVSAKTGDVIALGAPGQANGLVSLDTVAFRAFDVEPEHPPRIEMPHPSILHITSRLKARELEIHQWIALGDGVLMLASELHNVGATKELAITLGERIAWANTPTWLAGHGELLVGGSYGGAFLGRAGPGVAYAFCDHGGRVNVKSSRPSAPGFHRTHSVGSDRISIEAHDRSPLHRISIAHAPQSIGAAALVLPCAGARDVVTVPTELAKYGVETAYCETTDAHAARLLRDTPDTPAAHRGPGAPYVHHGPSDRIALPTECARVRLTQRGHAPGAWLDPRRDDEMGWQHAKRLPTAGTLRWQVRTDDESPLPCKLIVKGRNNTDTPDWGEDPSDGAAKNFIYTRADGEIHIPPGTYEVSVYRGLEYTRTQKNIEVEADAVVTVEAKLERVVDTAGWISADLHVHAMPSWDAPASLEERVLSLAGVGVEVGVATDHNAVTDYGPAIRSLGLEAHVASMVGDEVTTEHTMLGHFNVFPLAPGSEPLAHEHVHPHALFQDARRRANGGVIQVNHPRMGNIGYFELLHLDRGNVADWAARTTLGDMSFDAIEVFSGDHYAEIDEVRWVLDDWYALLEAGLRHAATGNSDSHKVAYQEAGMPRNWVAMAADQPAQFDADAFVASIRASRVVVSSGPFVRFTSGDHGIGDTLDAGERDFDIRVEAPPWIDVDTVELVRRGHVIHRYAPTGTGTVRLEKRQRVLATSGDWFIVVVSGAKSLPNTYRKNAKPFAFTNPIWIR